MTPAIPGSGLLVPALVLPVGEMLAAFVLGGRAAERLALPVLGLSALLAWLIAANTHVVKAALEWPGAASVVLVILQMIAAWVLVFALFASPIITWVQAL